MKHNGHIAFGFDIGHFGPARVEEMSFNLQKSCPANAEHCPASLTRSNVKISNYYGTFEKTETQMETLDFTLISINITFLLGTNLGWSTARHFPMFKSDFFLSL